MIVLARCPANGYASVFPRNASTAERRTGSPSRVRSRPRACGCDGVVATATTNGPSHPKNANSPSAGRSGTDGASPAQIVVDPSGEPCCFKPWDSPLTYSESISVKDGNRSIRIDGPNPAGSVVVAGTFDEELRLRFGLDHGHPLADAATRQLDDCARQDVIRRNHHAESRLIRIRKQDSDAWDLPARYKTKSRGRPPNAHRPLP